MPSLLYNGGLGSIQGKPKCRRRRRRRRRRSDLSPFKNEAEPGIIDRPKEPIGPLSRRTY
jgi:hypothetical protein